MGDDHAVLQHTIVQASPLLFKVPFRLFVCLLVRKINRCSGIIPDHFLLLFFFRHLKKVYISTGQGSSATTAVSSPRSENPDG